MREHEPSTVGPPNDAVIDMHTHFFPTDLPDLAAETGDARWPKLVVTPGDPTSGRIMLGDQVFRSVHNPLWDTKARLAAMDISGVDKHVVSPTPIALTSWARPDLALRFARQFNDETARTVAEAGGRVRGLGTVPLPDSNLAIAELYRLTGELGLHGIEIGTRIGGLELDAPELRPFFRVAARERVPIFIHPVDGSGATRCSSPIIDFGIGMHTDTTLAAHALVFGGVLEEFPDLRICLSHGGGAFPWTYPRLRIFDRGDSTRFNRLLSLMWTDALVFDASHLTLLVERFGLAHLVLGSDYPFITPDVHEPRTILEEAVARGLLDRAAVTRILGANAEDFLARS